MRVLQSRSVHDTKSNTAHTCNAHKRQTPNMPTSATTSAPTLTLADLEALRNRADAWRSSATGLGDTFVQYFVLGRWPFSQSHPTWFNEITTGKADAATWNRVTSWSRAHQQPQQQQQHQMSYHQRPPRTPMPMSQPQSLNATFKGALRRRLAAAKLARSRRL